MRRDAVFVENCKSEIFLRIIINAGSLHENDQELRLDGHVSTSKVSLMSGVILVDPRSHASRRHDIWDHFNLLLK